MIKCGHCRGSHETIDAVRNCSSSPGTVTTATYAQRVAFAVHPPMTGKQENFVVDLTAKRVTSGLNSDLLVTISMIIENSMLALQGKERKHVITRFAASQAIDALLSCPQQQQQQSIDDGMYIMDDVIYKVQHAVHGSGRQYAKRFVPPAYDGARATFTHAPGVIRKLRPEHRMTNEQAKAYGALYGTCVQCGRVLTKEESIERGMGDVCASKI